MEEENMEISPAQSSPHSDAEHPTSVADLNKKRKLSQFELSNSGLPWPKNKIRDRCNSSEIGNSPEESDSDCNSCIGTNDSAMSFDAKGKEVNNQAHECMEEDLRVEGHVTLREKYPAFGSDDDFNSISEYENDGTEVEDVTYADFMLYSNDAASNAFVHSSGKWSSGHDARPGMRKPTIDQEFEQYFSALML